MAGDCWGADSKNLNALAIVLRNNLIPFAQLCSLCVLHDCILLEKNSAVASKQHPAINWCSADGVIKCVAVRNETAKACVAIPTNNVLVMSFSFCSDV